ncbi:MAG TPA: MBL fold metallo-hydrolase [Bacteroidota bacterium]|nr:MBL fold metallo-hydrolase [Bacteroidota bacterium]
MKIGNYTVHAIETGSFALDGGAMFGIVPWVFWSKTNPPDSRNRITLAARCLLVIGNDKIILIDDGNGSKWPDKLKDIYRLDNSHNDLEKSLRQYRISPADVTDVILTHLHFDHCGGSTKLENGKLVPTFPKAQYHVQREHWNLAERPTEKDRGSFMKDDFAALNERGVLNFIEGERELFPGIKPVICNGHTSAQQLPLISDGSKHLLFCCDLVPTVSHIPYPYIMGYDVRPLVTLEEKKRILPRAAKEEWILFLEHDPDTEAVTLKETEKGFAVDRTLRIE